MKIKYWGEKEQDIRKGGMNRNKNWRGNEIYQEAKIASYKIKRTEEKLHIFESYNMNNSQITCSVKHLLQHTGLAKDNFVHFVF